MPYRKKRYRKKRVKRKRKKSSRRMVSMGTPSGLPTQRTLKLKYVEQVGLTSTLGGLATYVFSANSIFDPNTTGIGHQPMAHDTLSTMYNHYCVIGAKITCRWIPFGSGTGDLAACGVMLSDNLSTPYTDYTGMIEARKGSHRLMVNPRTTLVTRSFFSAKKFFNLTDVKDNQNRIGGPFGADPADPAHFILWYQNTQSASSNTNVTVEIDYIVQVSEPKELVQS